MKFRVLVVSCNRDMNKRLRVFGFRKRAGYVWLKKWQYFFGKTELCFARNCEEAEQALAEGKFDVLVIDYSIVSAQSRIEHMVFPRIETIVKSFNGPTIATAENGFYIYRLKCAGINIGARSDCVVRKILIELRKILRVKMALQKGGQNVV